MTPTNPAFPDPTPQPPGARTPNPIAGRIEPTPGPGPGRPPYTETPPAGLNSGPDMKALLRSLSRRWMLATVLSILLGGAAAVAAWILLTPEFSAFAQIRVSFQEPILAGEQQRNATSFGAFIKSQAALFKSRPIIQSALKKDEVRKLNLEAEHPDLPAMIEERLQVVVQDTSELMTATFSHRDPTVAVTLMKAMTDSFMENVAYERDLAAARDTELDKVITDQSAELKQKKNNLREMTRKLGTLDKDALARQREEMLAELRDLRNQRIPIRTALAKAEAELKVLDIQLPPPPAATIPPAPRIEDQQLESALRSDAVAGPMFARINAAKEIIRYYNEKATQPEREIPWQRAQRELSIAQGEVERRREQLRTEINERLATKYQQEIDERKAQLAAQVTQANVLRAAQRQLLIDSIKENKEGLANLEKQIDEVQNSAGTLVGVSAETQMLEKDITDQEERIANLKSKLETNKINGRVADRIRIHQEAAIMRQNAKKQMLATVASPLIVAGAICLLLAYVDYRQRRVYTAREVSSGLGIRVVGAVPSLPNLERRLVDPESELEGHPVIESIDALRTTLLRESQRERRRVILVTSAGAGEGKTTLAASLAISLARAGRRTLLIDGDLRSPAANQLFEMPLQPGFSEVVLAEVDAIDAIQPTHQENLFLLPAGQWDREVLQSLARDGLEGVLEKLREDYDFILIDSHPVLAATDSLLLAQRSDGVLLAVLRGVSQMPRVYAAAQRLSSLGVRVLGAVINGSDPEDVPSYAPTNLPAAAV